MNNAEYVKSLGLEFKDLTAKIEAYSEANKLYTWEILNKKTNKRIGSYRSLDKKDFPVVPVIIGEWLLQEDTYAKDHFNVNSKALLRYELNKIAKEFVNDTSISDQCLYKNRSVYFAKRQSYVDRVNKLLGKDLCNTFHDAFLNEEKKEIYIVYDGHHYTLGSVCGEKKDVHYDKINEFVDKYMNKDSKVVLRNGLTLIVMAFVYDGADNDMIARQVYIDKINKLVGKDICGICDFSFLHKKETNIYIDYRNEKYILGSVDSFNDRDYKNKTIYYKRIEAFTEAYEKNENSLLKRMLLVVCNEFEKIACDESINFSKKNAKCSELVKSVTKVISPAVCTYSANMEKSTHTQKYSLALLHQDKVYFIAKVNPNDDQKAVNENEIEEFIDAYMEDTANE